MKSLVLIIFALLWMALPADSKTHDCDNDSNDYWRLNEEVPEVNQNSWEYQNDINQARDQGYYDGLQVGRDEEDYR